ncbi:MAG: glycine zipper 2TM domain-containing protein [Sphingomonadaceae bacterium]
MTKHLSKFALLLAIPGLAMAVPVSAATPFAQGDASQITIAHGASDAEMQAEHSRKSKRYKRWERQRARAYDNGYQRGYRDRVAYNSYYDDYRSEPVYRDTRIWRSRDGNYYCRRRDGTTGLLVGAAVGGLVGNEIAGRGDRTAGTLLGAVGGAILGRAIDRSNARCQ